MSILYFTIPAVFFQLAPYHFIVIELNFRVNSKFYVLVDLCGKLAHSLLRIFFAGKRMNLIGLTVLYFLCIYPKYFHYLAHIFAEPLMTFVDNLYLPHVIHITVGKMSKI